jgi:hypothetical protein
MLAGPNAGRLARQAKTVTERSDLLVAAVNKPPHCSQSDFLLLGVTSPDSSAPEALGCMGRGALQPIQNLAGLALGAVVQVFRVMFTLLGCTVIPMIRNLNGDVWV